MKSVCATLGLFALLLVTKNTESRRVVGEEHWKTETSKQPMVDAIEGLLDDPISTSSPPKMKADCHNSDQGTVKKLFVEVEELEPRPNASAYNDDEIKAESPQRKSLQANKKQFEDDFEPRPNASSYNE